MCENCCYSTTDRESDMSGTRHRWLCWIDAGEPSHRAVYATKHEYPPPCQHYHDGCTSPLGFSE